MNDIIHRSLTRAGIPATREPNGLSRTDGKRPDGLTLIPWREGRCLIWDVTVADTTAASYLPLTAALAGSAAESAATRKEAKYIDLSARYDFVPVAIESHGIVPAGLFEKEEYAARTIRPRLLPWLDHALQVVEDRPPRVAATRTLRASAPLEVEDPDSKLGDK